MAKKKKFNTKNDKKSKIKVLAYCDSPTCATGFATVSRNILSGLYNTGRYDIDVLGINYWGDPHNFPFRIWPIGVNADRDPYGRKKSFGMIQQMEYDILFFLQDSFILDFLPELHNQLRTNNRKFRSIVYYPIDGRPKEKWIHNVNACDKVVAYSEFGKQESMLALPEMKEPLVIPHGVNTKEFFVMNSNDLSEFRQRFFGKQADKFIFTNLNRNQQRKDIPRTIMAFTELKKKEPNTLLYLHMAKKDQGWDLPEVLKAHGLSINDDVVFPENFGPNQGYPRHIVNMIYNISDCVVSTSLGEGFGLCLHPETNIYTERGIKKMEELTIKDKVLSSNGSYNEVEGIMSRKYNGDTYNITTWLSNIPIKSSPEHGFLVLVDKDFVWKRAELLVVGDKLVFPKSNEKYFDDTIDILSFIKPKLSKRQISNIDSDGSFFRIQSNFKKDEKFIPQKIKITPSLMRLFGIYLAEGSINSSKTDCILFSFNKNETELIEFVKTEMMNVFNLDYFNRKDSRVDYNGLTIGFYSSVVATLFKTLFGLGARSKSIHKIIYNQPKDNLIQFIYGEFMGDGSYGKTNYEISFSTVSKHIAYMLRLLLARLGILSSVRTSRVEYKVVVSGESKDNLLNMFNVPFDSVDRRFANEVCSIIDDFLVYPIKNIELENYNGKLIDIQVANTNDFVAENVVVHNSWIEAMATKTPVIMPSNTMLPEFISDDLGWLVKSGTNPSLFTVVPNDNEVIRPLVDVDDMVDKMLYVCKNKEEVDRRALNAYNFVSSGMDWASHIVPKWVSVFDSAVEELNNDVVDVEGVNVIEAESF